MAEYTDANKNLFWYEEHGSGEPLVLLHPGGADSRAFSAHVPELSKHFHVYLLERRGHGRTPDTEGPLTFEQSAQDTINFLEDIVGGPARLIGYSDGSIVGLMVAHLRPDLAPRVICAAGVYNLDGWMPGVIDTEQEAPAFMADSYGEISPDGRDHYAVVVKKLHIMHREGPTLSEDDLRKIKSRILVLVGDDDEATFEHTVSFYSSLPQGELAVIPGTSHGVLVEKSELCNRIMIDFMINEPIETFAPLRRS